MWVGAGEVGWGRDGGLLVESEEQERRAERKGQYKPPQKMYELEWHQAEKGEEHEPYNLRIGQRHH